MHGSGKPTPKSFQERNTSRAPTPGQYPMDFIVFEFFGNCHFSLKKKLKKNI
jgi:hypothetical protein